MAVQVSFFCLWGGYLRIVLEFQSSEESLALPLHYNELIQGMIYRNLEEALAGWLHDGGIPLGKRHFKLFTFSRLMGRYRIGQDAEGRSITFPARSGFTWARFTIDFSSR